MYVCMYVCIWSSTSEFTLLTITPFAARRQKLAYHAKCLRISWTYLDLYIVVGVLLGMIILIFVWRLPKGRCYGNQLNLEDVRRPLLFASAFDNELADSKSAFKKKIKWQ